MKKIAKSIRTMFALLLALVMSVAMVACGPETIPDNGNNGGNNDNNGGSGNTKIGIGLSASEYEIVGGISDDRIEIAVSVTNSTNKDYTLTTNHDELVKIEKENGKNYLSVIADTYDNVVVTVTATASADTSVTATKDITVKANKTVEPEPENKVSIKAFAYSTEPTGEDKVLNTQKKLYLNVTVESQNDDKSYRVSVKNPDGMADLVTYDEATGAISTTGKYTVMKDGKVVMENGEPKKEQIATAQQVDVIVTANADSRKTATVNLTVNPDKIDGQVGNLTSDMLREITNNKITVTGTFTDVYLADKTTYDYTVKMSRELDENGNTAAGSWYGAWSKKNADGSVNKNVQSVIYKLGANDTVEEAYINKNNVATTKTVKDSDSVPIKWSNQHYWNHIDGLANQVKKFKFDDGYTGINGDLAGAYHYEAVYGTIEFDIESYQNVYKPSEDDYLLKYLSWSMNPVLDEQFYDVYVVLNEDNTAIDRIEANTYPKAIYATDDDGNVIEDQIKGYSFTTAILYFSEIGSTEVGDPEPYVIKTNPLNAGWYDALGQAINAAKGMNNYAFKTTNSSLYAPSLNPDDYDISGTSGETGSGSASTSYQGVYDGKIKPYYYRSTSGDIGYLGVVTDGAILINETMKYDMAMDDYLYRTDPYGYKQNDDGTYDEFEFSFDTKSLKGQRKKTGNISSKLPDFDVAKEVFEYRTAGPIKGTNDKKYSADFALRDSAIIAEVANALCLSDFARYAVGSTESEFIITVTVDVDEEGNISNPRLSNVKFAYEIAGIYGGAYNTVYTNIGTAELPEGTFNNYVARVIPQSWSDYAEVEAYETAGKDSDGKTIVNQVKVNGYAALEKLFGAEVAANVPSPSVFATIFDDNVYGPWGNYDRLGTDSDGNDKIRFSLKINASSDNADENGKISDLSEKMTALDTALTALGFKIDHGNSEGEPGSSRYIVVYASEAKGLQIRIENNNSRYFWIQIFKYGEYRANK